MKDYYTVGEVAKLMNTTVRTLQYYDKENLLKPSASSEGGRRLYSAKDMIKLHQIMAFKALGFSLDEIKHKLFPLDSPEEVASTLQYQKQAIADQISKLQEAYKALDALLSEVITMKEVDFAKYADILELIKAKNESYWLWKYFDDSLTTHIKERFGDNAKQAQAIYDTYQRILEETLSLKRNQISPDHEKAIAVAEKWWNMILDFTGGDLSLLPELEKFNHNKSDWNNELSKKQTEIDSYLNQSLHFYFARKDATNNESHQ